MPSNPKDGLLLGAVGDRHETLEDGIIDVGDPDD
jgi:hypothetical protein